MTLTDFLLARIADDLDTAEHVVSHLERLPNKPGGISVDGHDVYDVRRALAECETKRAILALHYELDGGAPETYPFELDGRTIWPGCAMCDEGSPSRRHCDTVRTLAAVYADHPEYREEWRP